MKTQAGTERTKRVEEILARPYSRIVTPEPDGSGYSAEVAEFPGCFASGETAGHAYANLEKAAESWISACLEQSKAIPAPAKETAASGRVLLRLPRSLHARAARLAALDGASLNQFILAAIAERVGQTAAVHTISASLTNHTNHSLNPAAVAAVGGSAAGKGGTSGKGGARGGSSGTRGIRDLGAHPSR